MRLNRVESFYAFLLHFRNEGSKERGRSTMARPFAKATDHDQPPCRGGRPQSAPFRGGQLQPRPSAGAIACKRWLCCRWPSEGEALLLVAKPQGATASRGGGANRKGGCPLTGWLPAARGRRRKRRGGGAVKAKRVRASF
ncbi:hypothetical protein B296_00002348 [Ensete ventricosum]|uniref:Uncharacterized protein n=1 Tax=Ensete ventricosum TaxID=4639 RepID=A0A427AH98_ENSVE|nr:hypothetical protein B296_00002348 [Ensete ventricosum]